MSNAKFKERPCPGCRKMGKRPADELCWECTKKLADYDHLQEMASRLHNNTVCDYGFKARIPLPLAQGAHEGEVEIERFRAALTQCIDALSPIVPGENNNCHMLRSRMPNDGPGSFRNAQPTSTFKAAVTFAGAFDELLISLRLLLNHVYSSGRREGQNLLLQLQEGRISTWQFEENKNSK